MGTPWNIVESPSLANELLRLLAETMPDQSVFLPLDDPLFAERTIAYNSEDVIHVTRLAEQFDAVIQIRPHAPHTGQLISDPSTWRNSRWAPW